MIKPLFCFCLMLCLAVSCRSKEKLVTSGLEYKIKKIDSASSVYVIYVELSNPRTAVDFQTIKVVSKKTESYCPKMKQIKVGSNYKLNLHSIVPAFLPKNHLESVMFESISFGINDENLRRDLFISHNIDGLCYDASSMK